MNPDDKAHWLKPSPPLAVDGVPTRADRSKASPIPVPSETAEIPPSDPGTEVLSLPSRIDAFRAVRPRPHA
jgi:hypothetical protein